MPFAWYKADAGAFTDLGSTAVAADSDPVRQWNDQSGNGYHLTNAGGAVRPLYRTSRQNSRPAIVFDGTDDVLAYTSALNRPEPCEVWLVVKVVTWASGDRIYDLINQAGDFGWSLLMNDATPRLRLVAQNLTNAMDTLGTGTFGILRCLINLADTSLSLNNNTYRISGFLTGSGLNSTTPVAIRAIRLGSRWDGLLFGNFEVGEMLIYDRLLTEMEAQENWSYLNGRWKIF